ncbi:MAG: response regulator, partial [Planctomycetia bacterium]|nr:response regulator [Planctomycetia bacterium]
MVSTENDTDRIATAIEAGVDEFLSKPFTPEALARKLVALGVCTAAEAAGAGGRGPIRVLVVDDSATIRAALSAALAADPDLQVVGTAINGQVALAAIAASPPDLVLLDVEMPVLDGISTLREIRRLRPKLPVLMFSSLTERGSKATLDALLAGANDYVAKPAGLTPEEVSARIRDEVIVKIKALVSRGGPAPRGGPAVPARTAAPARRGPIRGVVIAVSTGGPTALAEVLPSF